METENDVVELTLHILKHADLSFGPATLDSVFSAGEDFGEKAVILLPGTMVRARRVMGVIGQKFEGNGRRELQTSDSFRHKRHLQSHNPPSSA